MTILEIGNMDGLLFMIIGIMVGPPIILAIIGIILLTKKKKTAGTVFLILAGVYLIVGLGICGSAMM